MNDQTTTAPNDLRIPGVRRGRKIPLVVDGQPVTAHEGETVHGALAAAGITLLGTSRKNGSARGVLCGMGICYQCRVTINGVPDQRACMTPVAPHMEIETDSRHATPGIAPQNEDLGLQQGHWAEKRGKNR